MPEQKLNSEPKDETLDSSSPNSTNTHVSGLPLSNPELGTELSEKYIKVETANKKRVISLVEEVLEKNSGSRIYAQKLTNGNYEVEVIEQMEEPVIS
jgi:hypothetical protein